MTKQMANTEVKYGKTEVNGREVGYMVWMEDGRKHEIIVPAYMDMMKLVDGKKATIRTEDVMAWTQVAGDMGTEELMRHLEVK